MRRVLLDEDVPRLLRNDLKAAEVRTVAEAGWAGTKNGELLRLASAVFDVFVTADRNLPHQQNLKKLSLGVVVLAGGSTKLEDLRPLASDIQAAIDTVPTGQHVVVPASP